MKGWGDFWRQKPGPVFTVGRSAHFAWGGLLTHWEALVIRPQYLPYALIVTIILAWLSEFLSFWTWEGDPFPFGDRVDFAAWIVGIGLEVTILAIAGVA